LTHVLGHTNTTPKPQLVTEILPLYKINLEKKKKLIKSEYQKKTTDLPIVTDNLYHIKLSSTPRHERARTHNFSGDRH
jgi:hypothetical protein